MDIRGNLSVKVVVKSSDRVRKDQKRAVDRMNQLETLKKFLKDESGQTTTEYILILAVIVTIFMQFRKKLLNIINKLFGQLDTATDSAVKDFSE